MNTNGEAGSCDFSTPLSLAPLQVAVIGSGPSSLFFCHAVEKLLRQQQSSHEERSLDNCGNQRAIQVTAFERSGQPGGLWQNANQANSKVSIYDNMWTNGPSSEHEFYDYTYEEHFGGQRLVDVYIRLQELLDYILG